VENVSALQRTAGKKPWHKKLMDGFDNSNLFPYCLIIPVLLFFIIWNLIPTLWMIGMSFYNYAFTTGAPEKFNGISNLIDIMNNDTVWGNLGRTFTWVLATTGIETVLGILLAFLFWNSAKLPGRRLALTLLFTPMLIAPASVGAFFKLLYEPDFGVINYLLSLFGIAKINFLGDLKWAFPAVTLVDVWMWTPFMILITLAALGSVPKAELEAAEIDRLPWTKRLVHIIWPYGKFVLMLGILLRTIDSFKTMDLIFMLTRGGPGNTTELVAIGLYRKAFEGFTMGWSSTLAVILLFIAIAFTSVYLYILNLSNAEKE